MIYAVKRGSGKLGIIKSKYDNCYEIHLSDGGITYWNQDQILRQSECLDELFNRIVIVTGKNNYQIKTKYQFGKLNWSTLLKDIRTGHRKIYGAVWSKFGLRYISTLNKEGEWEIYAQNYLGI